MDNYGLPVKLYTYNNELCYNINGCVYNKSGQVIACSPDFKEKSIKLDNIIIPKAELITNKVKIIKVDRKQKFDISLVSKYSTNYRWELSYPKWIKLLSTKSKKLSSLLGSDSITTWTFYGRKEGTYYINFDNGLEFHSFKIIVSK